MAAEPQASTAVQRRDFRSVLRVAGRAWWVVVVLALFSGIAAGVANSRGPTVYASRSVVTAVSTQIPVENFEIALTLFATDEVLVSVANGLGIDASTQQILATRTLEAEWISGGGLEITGRSTKPEAAVDLANLAAESFSTTLEEKGLGSFAVLPARSAAVIDRNVPLLDAASGVIIGGLFGLGLLAASFLIRQPIVSQEDALGEFPVEKAYGVSVRPGSSGKKHLGSEATAFPVGIETALIRDAGLEGGEHGRSVCCLLFEKGRRGDFAVRHLLVRMNILHRWVPGGEVTRYWLTPEDGAPLEALEQAGTVFLMVSEGSPRRPLREVAEEAMLLSSPPSWILVFVKRRRRRRSTKSAPARSGLLRRLVSFRGRPSRTPL